MRMAKRMAVICGCILTSAMCASASVVVSWNWDGDAGGGVNDHLGTSLLPAGNIIQLIYSPDAAIGTLLDSDPLTPQGGDILLDQQSNSGGSGGDGWWMFSGTYGSSTLPLPTQYAGGYVYQRVFEEVNTTPGTQAGDYYKDGPLSAALADAMGSPAPPPDSSNFFYSSMGGINVDVLIVPEPATMGLFGLGLVIMAIRRKIRG